MPIQFPSSPALNQEYTYEGKVWAWDGSSWVGVRQQTGILSSNIWAKQSLLIPKRGFGLNSGYNATTDQRRTKAGTIPMLKHNMERDLGEFLSVVGGGWTPANITTALWYDASDATTITLNGSTVSQWNDKSGNARHASQATTLQQPTYQATGYNSLPTLSFDGTNDSFVTSVTGFFPVTIGIVIKDNGSMGGVRAAIGTGTNSYALGVLTASPSINSFALWNPNLNRGAYINNAQSTNNTLLTANANSIDELTWNIFVNGSNTGQTQETAGTPSAASIFRIGYSNVGSEYWNGLISEIVILDSYASDATRQLIEGYLAHKWGLTSSLPADHPYKNAAP